MTLSGRVSGAAVPVIAATCGVVLGVAVVAGVLVIGLVAVAVLGASLLLRTGVTLGPEAVDVRLVPLFRRRIPADSVASVKPRTVAPLREFGGWGVRKKRETTALLLGSRAVQIELRDGQRYVVSVSDKDADRLSALAFP